MNLIKFRKSVHNNLGKVGAVLVAFMDEVESRFITVTIKIIDVALRDESAWKLNNNERKAIVSYLEVIKVQEKVILKKHLSPFISQSLNIINQYFDDLIILKDQDVLKDENCWNKVLACIPNM
ncbi:4232_t:CDS:2, partial [Entrophospora sp. SA101]